MLFGEGSDTRSQAGLPVLFPAGSCPITKHFQHGRRCLERSWRSRERVAQVRPLQMGGNWARSSPCSPSSHTSPVSSWRSLPSPGASQIWQERGEPAGGTQVPSRPTPKSPNWSQAWAEIRKLQPTTSPASARKTHGAPRHVIRVTFLPVPALRFEEPPQPGSFTYFLAAGKRAGGCDRPPRD